MRRPTHVRVPSLLVMINPTNITSLDNHPLPPRQLFVVIDVHRPQVLNDSRLLSLWFKGCRSWVWKAGTKECFLKSQNSVGEVCEDCVVYNAKSNHVLQEREIPIKFLQKENIEFDNQTITKSGPIYFEPSPLKEIVDMCQTRENGKDQPGNDLLDEPLIVYSHKECCNACSSYGPRTYICFA